MKSAKFLPDIPVFRATVNQNSEPIQQKKLEQPVPASLLRQGIHQAPSSHSSSPTSGTMANLDYKNVRTFGKLYDQSLNGRIRETNEKYRLGPRKVPTSFSKLPPLKQQQLWSYQNTIGGGQIIKSQHFGEGLAMNDSEQFSNDQVLRQTAFDSVMAKTEGEVFLRPVLKKNVLHYHNNVIVVFKSLEINACEMNEEQRNKWLSPLYLPVDGLTKVIAGSKKQIELMVLQKLNYDNNKGFKLKEKLQKELSLSSETQETWKKKNAGQGEGALPEVIRTSFLVTQGGKKEFQFVLRMPSIEYHIPSLNFSFIKYLSRQELQEFIDQSFVQWDELALKFFMQYRKFVEVMRQARQGEKGGQDEESKESMNVYVLSEQGVGVKVKKYSSFSAIKHDRQQKQQSKLVGCFQKEGKVGKLELTSFVIKIKSMDDNHLEHKEKIPFELWKQIVQFMRYQAMKSIEEAKSVLDKVGQAFMKNSNHSDPIKSIFQEINLEKYGDKKVKGPMNSARRKAGSSFFRFQKCSQVFSMNEERYLLELQFPSIRLNFQDHDVVKALSEDDCLFLIDSDFKDWKHYLIHQHFRVELNVGSHEPLPRIQEVRRGEEEDYVTEGDAKDRFPVANDEEKRSIERTREKLSHWFPY